MEDDEILLPEIPDEETDIETRLNEFEKSIIQNPWGYSELGRAAHKAAMSMLATKTGMYAQIPLFCKGDGCPYGMSCQLLNCGLAPVAELCPIEVAKIQKLYDGYDQQFGLDTANQTDMNIVKEIIDHDIKIDRCRMALNKTGELVEEVFAGVSQTGEEFKKPEVNKLIDVHDKLIRRRNELYSYMLATRKDQNGNNNNESDYESYINSIVSNADFNIKED